MRASWACATHVHAVKMSTGQKRALPAWFTLYPSDRIGCLPFAISRRGLRTLLESQLPDDVGCDIQGSIEPRDRSIVDIEDDLETLVLSNSRHGWFKPDHEGGGRLRSIAGRSARAPVPEPGVLCSSRR